MQECKARNNPVSKKGGAKVDKHTEKSVHGGDVYHNQVELDFSVNINPFGMPDGVKKAL